MKNDDQQSSAGMRPSEISAHQHLIMQAGKATSQHGEIPHILRPNDYVLEDIEHIMKTPFRKRGTFTTNDDESFLAYIDRYRNGSTTVYFDGPNKTMIAVFNDHCPGEHDPAGWKDWRAVLDTEGLNHLKCKEIADRVRNMGVSIFNGNIDE